MDILGKYSYCISSFINGVVSLKRVSILATTYMKCQALYLGKLTLNLSSANSTTCILRANLYLYISRQVKIYFFYFYLEIGSDINSRPAEPG